MSPMLEIALCSTDFPMSIQSQFPADIRDHAGTGRFFFDPKIAQ